MVVDRRETMDIGAAALLADSRRRHIARRFNDDRIEPVAEGHASPPGGFPGSLARLGLDPLNVPRYCRLHGANPRSRHRGEELDRWL